ncbi:tripartite tricarboxylate transporter substrate-binding protein [Cupriavidus basilensis]
MSSNHAINPGLYRNIPYDSVKDITAVALIGTTPLVLVVGAGSPLQDSAGTDRRGARPSWQPELRFLRQGSVLHLAGELLKAKAGIDMLHVPYKGVNTLMTDVLWRADQCRLPGHAIRLAADQGRQAESPGGQHPGAAG